MKFLYLAVTLCCISIGICLQLYVIWKNNKNDDEIEIIEYENNQDPSDELNESMTKIIEEYTEYNALRTRLLGDIKLGLEDIKKESNGSIDITSSQVAQLRQGFFKVLLTKRTTDSKTEPLIDYERQSSNQNITTPNLTAAVEKYKELSSALDELLSTELQILFGDDREALSVAYREYLELQNNIKVAEISALEKSARENNVQINAVKKGFFKQTSKSNDSKVIEDIIDQELVTNCEPVQSNLEQNMSNENNESDDDSKLDSDRTDVDSQPIALDMAARVAARKQVHKTSQKLKKRR